MHFLKELCLVRIYEIIVKTINIASDRRRDLNSDKVKSSVIIVAVQYILEYCQTEAGTADFFCAIVALIILLSRPLKFIASSET